MARTAINHLDIILDDNKKVYQIGEHILGIVELSLDDDILRSAVKINLVCLAQVEWIAETPQAHHKEQTFRDVESYLSLDNEVPNTFDKDQILLKGKHFIPFKFQIPISGIPSSFDKSKDLVNYFIQVLIGEDQKVRSKIIVAAPICDNLDLSVVGSTEHKFGLLAFASGKIRFMATVNKRGFVAGESIELITTVDNESSLDVTPNAALYKTQICMTGEQHNGESNAITEPVIGQKVEKRTSSSETLIIPIPKEVSLSMKTSVLSIKYFIHVTLDIPHAINLNLNLPIIITTDNALYKK